MRIGIDGFNLAIPDGTGVATYGAAMAKVLSASGHNVEGVFGIDPGTMPDARESLFFERFGQGDKRGLTYKRAINGLVRTPVTGPRMVPVHLTDHVDKRGFGTRWPAFSALWTSPLLFELAEVRFQGLGMMTTVHMPNPPAVMHWTYPVPVRMAGSRNVYTLHDLVPLKLPHTTRDNKTYYRNLISTITRKADHIATVSEASRNDIISMFDVDPDSVTNTYQSSPLPDAIKASSEEQDHAMIKSLFDLPPRGFFLFFGAADPKKNLGRIVDAYLASNTRKPLVIVSSRDWGMAEATGALGAGGTVYGRKPEQQIVQLRYLPRDLLFRLVRSARAVMFPSLYEGFGLPALEAIQLGTPVLGSTTSSLPEVIGEGGLLVDPYDTSAMASAIRRMDEDDALVAQLSAAGLAQAEKFSDQAFSEKLNGIYRKLGL
ncbi:glycosyltransferase family 4 protein [Novosphingobium sp. KACC 22771]|uniref:glycosyltransferase family 4 protein n=1 Tax=Novosphingobium sp. KACC 22771 TaxID=3025670 RepID=UPI002365F859|nr:glycosyltransferase family 1 protein [Novosphingobium sp. KACC 22771]WDF72765.1 glycosyltransferase family 1 protein [Novosphingobium sp. KACC 22771]